MLLDEVLIEVGAHLREGSASIIWRSWGFALTAFSVIASISAGCDMIACSICCMAGFCILCTPIHATSARITSQALFRHVCLLLP